MYAGYDPEKHHEGTQIDHEDNNCFSPLQEMESFSSPPESPSILSMPLNEYVNDESPQTMSPRTSSSRRALQDLQYSATPLTTLRVTSATKRSFQDQSDGREAKMRTFDQVNPTEQKSGRSKIPSPILPQRNVTRKDSDFAATNFSGVKKPKVPYNPKLN